MNLQKGLACNSNLMRKDEFDRRIAAAAGGLQALGIGAGDCIAILMRNDFRFLEASHAAAAIGATAVPVNWHFAAPEVDYVLADCDAKLLIGHSDLLRQLVPSPPQDCQVIEVDVDTDLAAAYRLSPEDVKPSGKYPMWEDWLEDQPEIQAPVNLVRGSMIYTSGTTGLPKGVRQMPLPPEDQEKTKSFRGLLYGAKPTSRALVTAPLYHSAPNGFGVYVSRFCEFTAMMQRFDAEQFLQLVERHRISIAFMVPIMFVRLLKLPQEVRQKYDISSLDCIVHGGAPCPHQVKQAMINWWGPIFNEFYGGTETGPVTFITSRDWLAKPGSVGRCIDEATLKVLDDAGNELPVGSPGELYGRIHYWPDFTYHKREADRAAVERDGLITCGDVGYLDKDGYLYLCDRKRDMVISGGTNIYPAEIEAVLIDMPTVQDCAVFGIPDTEFGEKLIAYVQPAGPVPPKPGEIVAYLSGRIADYKIPRLYEIHPDLPREDSGKIFKRRLRDPYWQDQEQQI